MYIYIYVYIKYSKIWISHQKSLFLVFCTAKTISEIHISVDSGSPPRMRGPTGATCMKGGTGGVMLGVIIVIGIGGVRVPKEGVIGVIGVITCRVQSTEANCVIILELEHHGFNPRFF